MDSIKIGFVGDICPGGVLHGSPASCVSSEVSDYLARLDLRVGTLESALGDNFKFDEDKMEMWGNIIHSKNEDTRRLIELGINAVSLANNHATDLGADGLANTLDVLDESGISHFGAGMNIGQAEAPLVIECRDKRIALMGFYDTQVAPHPASDKSWGVCTSRNIEATVRRVKQSCDYVFVLPHWGEEHVYRPLPGDKRFGRQIILAGADGVIGSHTHHVQPYIVYKKKPIFFSVGNFLFPDFYQEPPCPLWYPDGSIDITTIPSVNEYRCDHKRHVKHVWDQGSRIGAIAELALSDRIELSYRLTYLGGDNRITFLRKKRECVWTLSALGLAVRSPLYSQFHFLAECYFSVRRRLPWWGGGNARRGL